MRYPAETCSQFFYNLTLGDGDHVAFFGGIDTDGNPADLPEEFGFFRVDPDGTLHTLARSGTPAPGGGFFNPGNDLPSVNAVGEVAFDSQITGSPSTFGVFRADGTSLTSIARTNDVLGADTLFVPTAGAIRSDGAVVINTGLNGSSTIRALAIGDGLSLTTLIRSGDALEGGDSANVQPGDTPLPNSAGQFAIIVSDFNSFSKRILFRDDLGNGTLVMREGQTAPNGDGVIGLLQLHGFNESGAVLFSAMLSSTSAGGPPVQALYYWDGGLPIELFREGDTVDLNGSQTIDTLSGSFSDVGDDVVAVHITTTGDQAIVRATSLVNEDFDSAYTILSGIPIEGDLSEAVNDVSSSCDPASPDLFYAIDVATGPATLEVNTCGSTADTALAIFNSSEVELACSTDCAGDPCSGPDACVSASDLAPGTYYIRVTAKGGKVAGSSGEFALLATVSGGTGACCLPDTSCMDLFEEDCISAGGAFVGDQTLCADTDCFNDACAGALPIAAGMTPFSTIGATTDGPAHNPCEQGNDSNGQTFADIWYVYTADCTGVLTVTTCEDLGGSADYDTDIKVYTGSDCGSLTSTLLACNDDDDDYPCGTVDFRSTVYAAVLAGEKYLIRVGGWGSLADVGTGELLITCDPTTRACCFTDGSCATVTPMECVGAGGVYQMDAADCATGACASESCAPDICQLANVAAANTSDASPRRTRLGNDVLD